MTHIANHPFFALFGQMVARAWRVFSNRRQFAELKHWSDEQLDDIGLSRSDVRRALAQPFYTDPTSLLTRTPALHPILATGAANSPRPAPSLEIVGGCDHKPGQIAA